MKAWLLPEPLSPTTPRHSPASMRSETPPTASTTASWVVNETLRSSNARTGGARTGGARTGAPPCAVLTTGSIKGGSGHAGAQQVVHVDRADQATLFAGEDQHDRPRPLVHDPERLGGQQAGIDEHRGAGHVVGHRRGEVGLG